MGYARYHKAARWARLWEIKIKGIWKEGLLGCSPIAASSQLSKHVQFIVHHTGINLLRTTKVIVLKHNSETSS